MRRKATHTPNQPRPSLEDAKRMLSERGWTPSAGSWEDDNGGRVFAFAQESYRGTYGGAAAAVTWSPEGGWLSLPESKPANVTFV